MNDFYLFSCVVISCSMSVSIRVIREFVSWLFLCACACGRGCVPGGFHPWTLVAYSVLHDGHFVPCWPWKCWKIQSPQNWCPHLKMVLLVFPKGSIQMAQSLASIGCSRKTSCSCRSCCSRCSSCCLACCRCCSLSRCCCRQMLARYWARAFI